MENFKGNVGFCYVANTNGYVTEAEQSLTSLRKFMPNAQVAMIAPRQLWRADLPITHWVDLPNNLTDGPIVKTAAKLAPYDRVVFLDTDTYVAGDLSELFSLLDCFDIALAHEPTRGWDYRTPAPKPFCELNTGVILFKNTPQVSLLFQEWEKLFAIMKSEQNLNNDQPSFRTALWLNSNIRHATLPSEYHLICGKGVGVAWHANLLHHRGDLPKLAALINADMGPRVYAEGWGVLFGYRGRRLWIRDYLRLTLNFLKVLIRPSTLSVRSAPVKWW